MALYKEVNCMENQRKRINIYPDKYTTGDSQEWTYEYTWEDFRATRRYLTPKPGSELHILMNEITAHFIQHPEKLLEGGYFKEKGYDAELVKEILEGKRTCCY